MSHKINKKGKQIEPISSAEMPFSYLQSASMMLLEKNGASKLRARNDMIRGDLMDFAKRVGLRLETRQHGDRLWHVMPNNGITVCLISG